MEYGGRFSSASSSDSDAADTVGRLIREFGSRPGGVSYFEQRNVRRDRFVRRLLEWPIFEESSLNLGTLFGESQEDGSLPELPYFDADDRYATRFDRLSRRRSIIENAERRTGYGIEFLFEEPTPVAEAPQPQRSRDVFEDWAAGNDIDDAYAVGGNDVEDVFGDAIAQAAAGIEVDWNRFVAPRFYIDEARTSLGACLVGARSDIRRALITAVVRIRHTSPGINSRVAWRQLVARLLREGVVERESEVSRMWFFAFNESVGAHFQYIFEADFAVIYELWNHL